MGVPGGGDDEFRSVVFDESFVRAARIQEYSASERLSGMDPAVRTRRPWLRPGGYRQVFVLVVLIALAFGSAVYMGVRHPYRGAATPRGVSLRTTLVALAPRGQVPSATEDPLFAAAGGARYRTGAAGLTLPTAKATEHFTGDEVLEALTLAKDYLVASSLEEGALTDGDVRGVLDLLAPGQLTQFNRSLARPADDGEHAVTGWLVRFDPARIVLADPRVRVRGSITVGESGTRGLEVATDHTLVYSLRPVGPGPRAVSLFTVRRQLRLFFDPSDLNAHQVEVERAVIEAGPLDCASDPAAYFRPLLAGQSAADVAGTDPYDHRKAMPPPCGVLGPVPTP